MPAKRPTGFACRGESSTQADVNLNSGDWAELIVRYVDPDNYYAVRLGKNIGTFPPTGHIDLIETVRGYRATLASFRLPPWSPSAYTAKATVALTVPVDDVRQFVRALRLSGRLSVVLFGRRSR